MINFLKIFLTFSIIIIIITGCSWEPPRDNPADPGSDAWDGKSAVRFNLKSRSTGLAIDSASVSITEGSLIDTTDSDGQVDVRIPLGWAHYKIDKYGYKTVTDSTYVEYANTSTIVTILLDGLTSIDSTSITSVMQDNDNYDPDFFYNVFAHVSHPDGLQNVESVQFMFADESVYSDSVYIMEKDNEDGDYFLSLDLGVEGQLILPTLINQDVYIVASNPNPDDEASIATDHLNGFFYHNSLAYETRLTSSVPISDPTFEWLAPQSILFFDPIVYQFTLYESVSEDSLLIEGPLLLSFANPYNTEAQFSHTVEANLSVGYYKWQLAIFDPLGNRVQTRFVDIRIQ